MKRPLRRDEVLKRVRENAVEDPARPEGSNIGHVVRDVSEDRICDSRDWRIAELELRLERLEEVIAEQTKRLR